MNQNIIPLIKEFIHSHQKPLLALVGVTASGKTTASVKIAEQINGEIINADAKQIYMDLDISTNKATKSEMKNIPHHLFSFLTPNQLFTVAEWKKMAEKKAYEILQRGKIPILCGGTGLYINAITKNFTIPAVAPNHVFREKMEQLSNEQLWDNLHKLDPESAQKIAPQNRVYLIRALEIIEFTDIKKSEANCQKPLFDNLLIGISINRKIIYENINQRVIQLIELGMLDEVQSLLKKGYTKQDPGMLSHGVPEAVDYLNNQISKEEFIDKMSQNTRKYAKRQLTWWRKDSRVIWFNPKTNLTTNTSEIV